MMSNLLLKLMARSTMREVESINCRKSSERMIRSVSSSDKAAISYGMCGCGVCLGVFERPPAAARPVELVQCLLLWPSPEMTLRVSRAARGYPEVRAAIGPRWESAWL